MQQLATQACSYSLQLWVLQIMMSPWLRGSWLTLNIWKSYMRTAVEEYGSYPCSYEHYLSSGENKAWKKI